MWLLGARNVALPLTGNKHLLKWVEKMAELTKPAAIHWVDGSQEEYDAVCAQMVEGGTFIKLNEDLWPGCYYARSDASDVARVEDRILICSLSKDNAGPTKPSATCGSRRTNPSRHTPKKPLGSNASTPDAQTHRSGNRSPSLRCGGSVDGRDGYIRIPFDIPGHRLQRLVIVSAP